MIKKLTKGKASIFVLALAALMIIPIYGVLTDSKVETKNTKTGTWCYTVTFNSNGGSAVSSQTINHGGKVVVPPNPTRVGYTFKGWSPAIGTVITKDTTFNAQWDINKYTVTFDSKGGTAVPNQIVSYGGKATTPTPSRTGYIFGGWSPNPADTVITGNRTFTASWTPTKQTLRVNPNGGSFRGSTGTTNIVGDYDTLTTFRAPTRTGYKFTGWTKVGTGVISGYGSPYRERTTAQLQQDDYWMDNINPYNNKPTTSTVVHTKPTLAVNSWSGIPNSKVLRINTTGTASPGHGGYYQSTVSAANKEYYHVIVANIPVGSTISQANNSVGDGSKFEWLTPRVGTGKSETYIYKLTTGSTGTFATWSHVYIIGGTAPIQWDVHYSEVFDATSGRGDALSRAFTYDNKNNLTLTANWEKEEYNVTFDTTGGNAIPAQKVKYQENVVTPPTPTRVGYTFAGWTPSITTAITKDTKFTASWTLNSYTVTFNSAGGTTVASQTINHGGKVVVPPNPTRVGYTFTGWSPAIGTTITGPRTFTAQWEVNKYTVTFNANGGTGAPASQTKTYGTALTLSSTVPTRTGYTFTGWNTNSAGTGTSYAAGANYTANSAVTLYAQWTINKYTATFNTDGGSAVASQSVNYNSTVTTPADPTRTGYTFTGWSPALTTPMTQDRTFTAQWTINKYTVQFNLNGGTSTKPANQTVNHGSKATIPTNPTRAGHTFAGWSPNINNEITGNTTFVAQWTINTYTVSFNNNGGTGSPGNQTKTYGTNLTLSSTKPTRTGYTFSGWNTAANGTGTSYAPGASYTANSAVTLYAQWTINTYTVTFDSNGGSAVASQRVTHGSYATRPNDPTRAGYIFKGWSPYLGTSIRSNTTFVAQWEIINEPHLNYHLNNGSGEVVTVILPYGTYTITSDIPFKEGYVFKGWNTKEDGTGATYTAGSNWGSDRFIYSNLYAQWRKNT